MIGKRLARIRSEAGLSLRQFRERVSRAGGLSVSYSSVRNYERSDSVPSDYLGAVIRAFGVDPRWLLLGEGPAMGPPTRLAVLETLREIRERLGDLEAASLEEALDAAEIREAWERYRDRLHPGHALRETILESWCRCEERGVASGGDGATSAAAGAGPSDATDGPSSSGSRPGRGPTPPGSHTPGGPGAGPPPPAPAPPGLPPRVPDEELARHLARSAKLVEAARPHMAWLSDTVAPRPHVIYVACRHGIVLYATGDAPASRERSGLTPGHDWSEATMGTNGAGTALATGRPTVVMGPEHYLPSLRDYICTAVPVRDPAGGELLGALDLSTPLRHGDPRRLALVAYAAWAVEHDLRAGGSDTGP